MRLQHILAPRRVYRSASSVGLLCLVTIGLIGLALWAGPPKSETCQLTLEFLDADNGQSLPGMLRITDAKGQPWLPPELLARDLGRLPPGRNPEKLTHWTALPRKTTVTVPRQKLAVEALAGLETELEKVSLDLSQHGEFSHTIRLKRIFRAAEQGFRSANTHLHLMHLTREQSDRYLTELARVDGLDVLFVSYLERPSEQQHYISNRYTRADLEQLSKRAGVAFGNGEEHRHNATGYGEGYGHVMLLDIPQLVQPVSIGKGIMQQGTDGIPLQRGLDTTRRMGGTTLWCHNDWGLEDIANWVTGRLQAQNIFDGGPHGSYHSSFYRYLNAGLRVPFSTGTDWFLYDFSRVYVPSLRPLTPKEWLKELAAGRSSITNGPFLELRVDGRTPGDQVSLDRAGNVSIVGKAVGRVDFRRIEVMQNGKVIRAVPSQAVGKHFEAVVRLELPVSEPCWFALRIPPPPVKESKEPQEPAVFNELNQPLFAHTSPVYLRFAGHRVFDKDVVRGLIKEMEDAVKLIDKEGDFADASEKSRVLDVYREAIRILTEKRDSEK